MSRPDAGAQAKTDPKPITDDKRWKTGDVTLISSDNVRFRPPEYLLKAGR